MWLLSTSLASALLAASVLPQPARSTVPDDESAAAETLFVTADKLVVRPGKVLEGAQILVQNGIITAVGTDLEPPDDAKIIHGAYVCAGFIDPWSTLGVSAEGVKDTTVKASTRALDAFDPYSQGHLFEASLRAGVTSVRSQVGAPARVGGVGCVWRLDPDADVDAAVVLADAVVAAALGISATTRAADVLDRQSQIDKLVGDIESGLKYRRDEIEYRYEIEEWREAIAEKEKELEKDFKKAKKARDKKVAEAEEKDKKFKDKKYKEDKQPKRPKFDANKEVMARVANGELPLIVEVHRAAELRNLLALTAGFDRLRLIIAGATEGMHVAETLAERDIPVIVWPAPLGTGVRDEWQGHDLSLAARLAEKGVNVLLGSGGGGPETRDLPLLAGLAIGHGLDRARAFEALTSGAAQALDVGDRIGSVERGKDADLLVLDGEPLATLTRVRYVVCGGRLVITPEN